MVPKLLWWPTNSQFLKLSSSWDCYCWTDFGGALFLTTVWLLLLCNTKVVAAYSDQQKYFLLICIFNCFDKYFLRKITFYDLSVSIFFQCREKVKIFEILSKTKYLNLAIVELVANISSKQYFYKPISSSTATKAFLDERPQTAHFIVQSVSRV